MERDEGGNFCKVPDQKYLFLLLAYNKVKIFKNPYKTN